MPSILWRNWRRFLAARRYRTPCFWIAPARWVSRVGAFVCQAVETLRVGRRRRRGLQPGDAQRGEARRAAWRNRPGMERKGAVRRPNGTGIALWLEKEGRGQERRAPLRAAGQKAGIATGLEEKGRARTGYGVDGELLFRRFASAHEKKFPQCTTGSRSHLAISCRRDAPRFAFIARGEGALEGKGDRFCALRGGFMFTLRRALPAGRAALRLYRPGRCAGVLECKDGRFCASRGGSFQRRKRIPLSFWVVVARGGDLTFRGTPPGRAGRSPPTSP